MPISLSNATLGDVPAGIGRPGYDRGGVRPGIAHLAVGNFHRAHLALYLDRCLREADQAQWGLLGVGVLDNAGEQAKAAVHARQDGLYTLAQYAPDRTVERQVVGSIVAYRHAPHDPAGTLARLADPAIRIVSLTVTEGGYNLDGDGRFRLENEAVRHDLAEPGAPRSVFGMITGALARRRADGIAPFTVLSCDNLQHNGETARRAVTSFAEAIDPELARWMADEVDFPNSMVDRITPAVSDADRARLNAESGVDDGWPVFAEDFIQWVVEDKFRQGRPALERVGVQFTDEVGRFEAVKLRMLNASHVMLAYPAMLAGHRVVHEAMGEPVLRRLLDVFMTQDAMPTLTAPRGMSLGDYRDTLLSRFTNPAIGDQVARLCSDGAAKLPVFVGPTLKAAFEAGSDLRRLAFLCACYVRHLAGVDERGALFEPIEPGLSAEDYRRAASADLADHFRLPPFRAWGLESHETFASLYADLHERVGREGAFAVAEAVSK